jgi:hypothetical protein
MIMSKWLRYKDSSFIPIKTSLYMNSQTFSIDIWNWLAIGSTYIKDTEVNDS